MSKWEKKSIFEDAVKQTLYARMKGELANKQMLRELLEKFADIVIYGKIIVYFDGWRVFY